jgi:hypothetical protein
MRQYRFEIVGRAFGRFTWRLVELRGRRRRVLARSDRDYSSLEKVRAAIAEFREIVRIAGVVDTTLPGETPFELPPTRFEFVEGVVPLVVEESPDEDDEFSEGLPEPARQKQKRQEPERQKPPAEPARLSRERVGAGASTATQERATRSTGRRRKGT